MATQERNDCMNEIQLLRSMQHPHIIQYLDCCIEQNELTVVMELVRTTGRLDHAHIAFRDLLSHCPTLHCIMEYARYRRDKAILRL